MTVYVKRFFSSSNVATAPFFSRAMCFKKTVVFLKHFFAQKVRAFPLRKGVRVARGYVEGVAWYRHDSDIVARARRRGRLPPPIIQKKNTDESTDLHHVESSLLYI